MKSIVELSRKGAIEAIKDTTNVMYKHGVWNNYTLVKTEDAIRGIEASGYGADVDEDDDGMFYVCVPASCDMW